MEASFTASAAREVHSGRFPWGEEPVINTNMPGIETQKATIIDILSANTSLINEACEGFGLLFSTLYDPQFNHNDPPIAVANVDCLKAEVEYQNEKLKILCKMLAVLLEQFGRR